jgi:hypothetical protein
MLELRPHCENCQTSLPPESEEARICSFECTFCRSCVEGILLNVCPNCGGGFERRPVRPKQKLVSSPAALEGRYHPIDATQHAAFAAQRINTPPAKR